MEELPEEEKPGIPGWVVTFADLMSLLMCFFVLLLSFSEIDAQKFKQIAGELSKAFGVQREVPALEIPQGTSPIFDTFAPAPPEPTLLEEVRQSSATEDPQPETLENQQEAAEPEVTEAIQDRMDNRMDKILTVLEPAVVDGRINVSQDQTRIIVRIEEKGSFKSASADITYDFEGLLLDMAVVLAEMPGEIDIQGHTDDLSIRTSQFASNWNLSAARAAAVANVLLARKQLAPDRIRVTGMADTDARVPNTSAANRAKNRRVEIVIDLADTVEEEVIRLQELIDAKPSRGQKPILEPTIEPGPTNGQFSW